MERPGGGGQPSVQPDGAPRAAGRLQRTYAGLAAAAGRGAAVGMAGQAEVAAAGRGSGGSDGHGLAAGYSRDLAGGPPRSAFFKVAQGLGPRQGTATAVVGSFTPPGGRPAARIATPDSAASPFVEDDDILFQMSGLKPLRTSSRTAAAATAAAGPRSHKKQPNWSAAHSVHLAADVLPEGASPAEEAQGSTLSRAFSFAEKLSPRAGMPPLPAAAAVLSSGQRQRRRRLAEDGAPVAATQKDDRADLPASPDLYGRTAAGADLRSSPCSAEGAGSKPEDVAAPGWSEELLNWMLTEKAGLLVEAQRAARRQQELEAELGRARARNNGAEREAQRLAAERRLLLQRVQQVSAAEAEAAARVERLAMENDALTAELERSQEVCREMLAARRAARSALDEMSAQNARLLAAYVEKKQEAAQLKQELRRQQRQSEARMQALEAQLQAVLASRRGMLGSLRSPDASPPAHATSPGSERSSTTPEDGIATPRGLRLEDSIDGRANCAAGVGCSPGSVTPGPAFGCSPLLNKENANANAAGTGNGSSRAQRVEKAQWDEERSELLTLLERLQGQLQAHADQQHGTAGDDVLSPRRSPSRQQQQQQQQQSQEGPPPHFRHRSANEEEEEGQQQQQQPGGSSAEASYDSAAECAAGESPAVMAHHVADSPLPPRSGSRSSAPSPPSVRPQRSKPDGGPSSEEQEDVCAAAARLPDGDQQQQQQHLHDDAVPSHEQQQQQQQQQQQYKVSTSCGGGSQTLEAFLGRSLSTSPMPDPPAADASQAEAEQQRALLAEQRAAELEAEVVRLRDANAAAEQKMQREELRRAAEAAKANGNAAFQAQNFEAALRHYTAGLESLVAAGGTADADADGSDTSLAAVLHCNRAAAHQACGRYMHALADCFRAEAINPTYARLYHRRADAFWAIGAWDAAAQDLERLLELGAGQDAAARLVEAQRRAQAAQPPCHYAVLGLRPAATPGEVKTAFRQLALAFHPDKAAGLGLATEAAHTLFQLLSEAAAVLGDAEKRRHHDIAMLRHKYRRCAGF